MIQRKDNIMIERLKNHMKELKQTLAPLPWGQKIEHLWIYYKHVLFIAIAVVFFIWFICNAVFASNQDTILSGTALNLQITQEGLAMIDQELTHDGQLEGRTFLDEFPYLDIESIKMGFMDEQTATYLLTRISSQSLDYILMSENVLNVISENYFIDMRLVFPEETLSRWPLIYKTDEETGERMPIGIDITGTDFAQEYVLSPGNLYLTATAGILHPEAFTRLADYLLQSSTATP